MTAKQQVVDRNYESTTGTSMISRHYCAPATRLHSDAWTAMPQAGL